MLIKRIRYVSLLFASAFLMTNATQAAPKKTIKQKGIEKTMKQEEDIPKPILGQRKMMEKLLEMIKTSNSIKDFTPERLGQVFGVPIEKGSSGYGYGEQLTKDWRQGFAVSGINDSNKMEFEIGVYPDSSALLKNPIIDEVCDMDYKEFVHNLVDLGFPKYLLESKRPAWDDYRERPPVPTRSIHLKRGELNLRILRQSKRNNTDSFSPDGYCVHTVWVS